jgi:pyruvate,water dikinase
MAAFLRNAFVRPVKSVYEKWRERRRARAMTVLDDLKVRYHTFSVLLTNNETSLNLLRSVDQSLKSPVPSRSDLPEEVEELLDVTYELVDGLNRLTGGRYSGLYERHRLLAGTVREALDTVVSRPAHALRCIPLNDLNLDCKGLVGGKASTLAFLRLSGFPVPDGFAVTAEAGSGILSENGLDSYIRRRLQRLQSGHVLDTELQTEADYIRGRILDAPLPVELEAELKRAYERLTAGDGAPVSVRSSALVEDRPEHSFAGQFKSVLNVTSWEALKTALKEVVASNYSARSISYRLQAGLPLGSHDMAVLCQRMIQARAAGVLFTVDPAAPESGRALMSAVPGLGISAVSGSAPADLYRPLRQAPDSEPMDAWTRIADKTHRAVGLPGGGVRDEEVPGEERKTSVVSEEEALTLVRYGRMIESLLGRPQDIEWAISAEGGTFILQSRDIRLSVKDRQAVDVARGKVLLRGRVRLTRTMRGQGEDHPFDTGHGGMAEAGNSTRHHGSAPESGGCRGMAPGIRGHSG